MEIEKLIEKLRTESLYKDKATLEIMDLCMDAALALGQLRDESEKLKAQVPSWIPVEERLPNPKQNVLAYSPKSGIAEADYADGVWMRYRWSSVMDGVTHWMPLPKLPKEDSHD